MADQRRSGGYFVHLEGIKQVRLQLKGAEIGLPQALKESYKRIAELIEIRAKGRALSQGGVAAFVAPTIKSGATQTAGFVRLGVGPHSGSTRAARRARAALGAEFGSSRYKQFKPWKGNGAEAGYFLYPTIRDNQSEVERAATEEVDEMLDAVFPA